MDAEPSRVKPPPASPHHSELELSWMGRLRARLLGYDVFISYRHADGLGYAMALENRLRTEDVACFRDARELPGGTPLRERIAWALKKSRLLVLVGTKGVAERPGDGDWIRWELQSFDARRTLFPIWFEGASRALGVPRLENVEVKYVEETESAREPPKPSDRVVAEILGAMKFRRANQRMRALVAGVTTALLALLTLSGVLWGQERERNRQYNEQKRLSEARAHANRSTLLRTRFPVQLEESMEEALAAADGGPELLESDQVLRSALALYPPLSWEHRVPCRPQRVKAFQDHLLIAGDDVVCTVDLKNRRVRELWRTPHSLSDMDVAPNGSLVALATSNFSQEGKLTLVDPRTGQQRCAPFEGSFTRVAVSQEGAVVAAASRDGRIHHIDVAHCRLRATTLALGAEPTRLELDARGVLVGATGKSVRAWRSWSEASAPLLLDRDFAACPLPFLGVAPVAFSPTGALSTADGCTVQVSSAEEGQAVAPLRLTSVQALWWGREGLVAALAEKRLEFWDAAATRKRVPRTPIMGEVPDFGPRLFAEGELAVTTSRAEGQTLGAAHLWDVESGREVARLPHGSRVRGVFPGPEGVAWVSVGDDRMIRFWGDIRRRNRTFVVPYELAGVASTDDASLIATAHGGICKICRRWSVWDGSGEKLAEVAVPDVSVRAMAWSGDSAEVLVADDSGLWRWRWRESKAPVRVTSWPGFRLWAGAFGARAETLVAVDGKGQGRVWRGPDWGTPRTFTYQHPSGGDLEPWSSGLSVTPDGRGAAIALTGSLVVVELDAGRQRDITASDRPYRSSASGFSPDGTRLAVAALIDPHDPVRNPIPALDVVSLDGTARKSERLAAEGYNNAVCFGPEGRVAAAVGEVLRVWSVESDLRLEKQIEQPWVLQGCRFIQNGASLLVWGSQHVQVLSLDIEAMKKDGRARLRP